MSVRGQACAISLLTHIPVPPPPLFSPLQVDVCCLKRNCELYKHLLKLYIWVEFSCFANRHLALQRKRRRGYTESYRPRCRVDDAHTGRWCVVDPLPFLSVGVPDVVHVLLLELVIRHAALGKLCPPEGQGRIQRQPNALLHSKHCG